MESLFGKKKQSDLINYFEKEVINKGNGDPRFLHTLNELVRTTILNIDRVAVQVSVQVKEAAKAKATNREAVNVVEYYTASHAPYKTSRRREICKTILADKSYGIPLLALDKKTSDLLGIMTVEQAMTTLEGAMGPHCHHGVRPIPVVKRKELEKIIRERR